MTIFTKRALDNYEDKKIVSKARVISTKQVIQLKEAREAARLNKRLKQWLGNQSPQFKSSGENPVTTAPRRKQAV